MKVDSRLTSFELGLRAEWRLCSSNHGNSPLYLSVISSDAFRGTTLTEEAEPLDIWAAIKPGHVREKIALFASDGRWPIGHSTPPPGAPWDREGGVSGLWRLRKSKGTWEEKGGAKRQRHSGKQQNVLMDLRPPKPSWSPGSAAGPDLLAEGEEPTVSVVDMVACLEKRFQQQQKPPAASSPLPAPPTEPDSIRVSAMVTRLESDCLRTQVEASSLKRAAGRVLLATAARSSSPCQPSSTPLSAPPAPREAGEESTDTCLKATPPAVCSGEPVASQKARAPPSQSEEAEPPPGLLFRTPAPPQVCSIPDWSHAPSPEGGGSEPGSRASACAFLEVRWRLRRRLEPPPFLTLLPHHLLLHIFALLPTRSLAALQCACRYSRLIIDTYDVRPADSLWVRDPGYSDDPCKQCKKRRSRGDVSLCRWHHKPFCRALPDGPGYWMCCRSVHKDAPGCNAGLHDNRWVPAFHSRNLPIYRWSPQEE